MPTDVSLGLLKRVAIASPCTARWDEMTGDDRVRHCGQCNLKVHDLSAMGRDEAEALLASHFAPGGANRGERLCGAWRRRADGTIIFGDCPVGLARVRARVKRSVVRACAMLGVTTLLGGMLALAQRGGWNPRECRSFALVSSWLGAGPAEQQTFRMMGAVAPANFQPVVTAQTAPVAGDATTPIYAEPARAPSPAPDAHTPR